MPPSFILFGKSIVTIENVALDLNPDFDLIRDVRPLMVEIFMKQAGTREMLKMQLRRFEKTFEAGLLKMAKKVESKIEKMIDNL